MSTCLPTAQPHPEPPDQLTAAERAMVPEVAFQDAMRTAWKPLTDYLAEDAKRRSDARAILADDLSGISWEALMRDPTRGEVACKLYKTWSAMSRQEAVTEQDYSCTGIYADLELAMNAHGLATFEERCAILGKKFVESAIAYVLRRHDDDAACVEAER